ncbi:hypothetical protein ACLESO_55820, partial [Pyxidicoccus sp. 3LG]
MEVLPVVHPGQLAQWQRLRAAPAPLGLTPDGHEAPVVPVHRVVGQPRLPWEMKDTRRAGLKTMSDV